MRGGYIIADFKKSALTSGEQASIEGLFNSVSNPYNKAVMVSGLVVGDVEYPDFYAVFVKDSNNYKAQVVINGTAVSIEVTPDDNVTVTTGAGTLNTSSTTRTAKSKSL